MKIIELKAENIKKLVAIDIIPKGNTVILTGANGEGKTSVMDCISWAFEGKAKIQKCPIRFGENKAWIEIDTEKYTVRRDFKFKKDSIEADSTLTVTSKDESTFSSPQALLDTVFGELAFDPLAFSRASSKDQVAALEGLVKDFDFAKSRAEEELAYNERTIVNRKVKDASQTHVAFKDVPVVEPEKVDVKGLTDKLASVANKNAETEKLRAENERKRVHFETNRTSSENLFNQEKQLLRESEKVFEEAKKTFEKAQEVFGQAGLRFKQADISHKTNLDDCSKEEEVWKNLPVLPLIEDVASIKTELESAQAKNALHEQWTKKDVAKKAIEEHQAESQALTEKIEMIQAARRAAVAGAGLPVEGLGFDETGVTLNGIPFDQCSSGEKLKTSVALAMLSNPDLRVIRVADGSLLDDAGLELLSKLALEKDYQIWIEKTDSSGKIGIVLEDGKVKG